MLIALHNGQNWRGIWVPNTFSKDKKVNVYTIGRNMSVKQRGWSYKQLVLWKEKKAEKLRESTTAMTGNETPRLF